VLVQFFSLGHFRATSARDFEFLGTTANPTSWPLRAGRAYVVGSYPVPGPNPLFIPHLAGRLSRTLARSGEGERPHRPFCARRVFIRGNLIGETGDGDAKTRATPRITSIDLTR